MGFREVVKSRSRVSRVLGGGLVLTKTHSGIDIALREVENASSHPLACIHIVDGYTVYRVLKDTAESMANLFAPYLFCHMGQDWIEHPDPPLFPPEQEILQYLLVDGAQRLSTLDNITVSGEAFDFDQPHPPDFRYECFNVRAVQIAYRTTRQPALTEGDASGLYRAETLPEMILALNDIIAEAGNLRCLRKQYSPGGVSKKVSLIRSILDVGLEKFGEPTVIGPDGYNLTVWGGHDSPTMRRAYTIIPSIAIALDQKFELPEIFVPLFTFKTSFVDVAYDLLTTPVPFFDCEILAALHLLKVGIFDRILVGQYDDRLAVCANSTCGPGFPGNILQTDLDLSAVEGEALFQTRHTGGIRAIVKSNPSVKDRARTVCGLDCLTTAAGKAATKPAQTAIVRLTQGETPGLSAIGLARDSHSLNKYFRYRTRDSGAEWAFGADHTKCDRTVNGMHVLLSYGLLHQACGFEVTPDFLQWVYNAMVDVPVALPGAIVTGRQCEASGDAATCHTNTFFNVLCHVTVYMRSILSSELESPNLRRHVYEAYHEMKTDVQRDIVQVFMKRSALVVYSDDGLVISEDPVIGEVFEPGNWSRKLSTICSLPVVESKSEKKLLIDGVEFLGGHLMCVGGVWSLAPALGTLARQLMVVERRTVPVACEALAGILISAAGLTLRQPEEFKEVYQIVSDYHQECLDENTVSPAQFFPTWEDLCRFAAGTFDAPLQEQGTGECPCGVVGTYRCPMCPYDVAFCALHGYEHFSTTTHGPDVGACFCGIQRVTLLGAARSAPYGIFCTDHHHDLELFVDAKAGRMGCGEVGDCRVSCRGYLGEWVLPGGLWDARRVQALLDEGQFGVFRKAYGDTVLIKPDMAPGERFKVRICKRWESCVVDSYGVAQTRAGPLKEGRYPVAPNLPVNVVDEDCYNHLRRARYVQGPPGCGKTQYAFRAIMAAREGTVVYCAPSNQAVSVMFSRLEEAGCVVEWVRPRLATFDYPPLRSSNIKVGTIGCIRERADLVIVDEVSLAGPGQIAAVASLGKRVLLIGDHLQLAPVTDTAFSWVDGFWLLDAVGESEQLRDCWRCGDAVVRLFQHLYPEGVRPAGPDTVVEYVEETGEDYIGQVMTPYRKDLQVGWRTVDSCQGDTFPEATLVVRKVNDFTTAVPRVIVGLTRASQRLRIIAPEAWFDAVGFIRWPEKKFEKQAGRDCYIDLEFAHVREAGGKNFLCALEWAIYDPAEGKAEKGICPVYDRNGEFVVDPKQWFVPKKWRHLRSAGKVKMKDVAARESLLQALKGRKLVAWNGSNDIAALAPLQMDEGTCQQWDCDSTAVWSAEGHPYCDKHRPQVVDRTTFSIRSETGGKLSEEHVCPFSHGVQHTAECDAKQTACVIARREGLGRRKSGAAGLTAVPLLAGEWSLGDSVVVGGVAVSCAARSRLPLSHSQQRAQGARLVRLLCDDPPCRRCVQLDRRIVAADLENPEFSHFPLMASQVALSDVVGFEPPNVIFSGPPFQFPYQGSLGATIEAARRDIGKPLPLESVLSGLGIRATVNLWHPSTVLFTQPVPGALGQDRDVTDGFVVSWSRLSPHSVPAKGAGFVLAGRVMVSESEDDVPYWLTKRVGGESVELPLTYFSTGRLIRTDSTVREAIPQKRYQHVFEGDIKGTKITGVHHISSERLDLKTLAVGEPKILASCNILGARKANTSVIDIGISDYQCWLDEFGVTDTESKMQSMQIDFHKVRVMTWSGVTSYPVNVVKQFRVLPRGTFSGDLSIHPGKSAPNLPQSCYFKYMDVVNYICAYLTAPRKQKLRILNFGARGRGGDAQGDEVLVERFPNAIVHSYDINTDYTTVAKKLDDFPTEQYHIIISDAWALNDGGKLEADILRLPELLAPGGWLLVKVTRFVKLPLGTLTEFFHNYDRFYCAPKNQSSETWVCYGPRRFGPGRPLDSTATVRSCGFDRRTDSPNRPVRSSGQALRCVQVIEKEHLERSGVSSSEVVAAVAARTLYVL